MRSYNDYDHEVSFRNLALTTGDAWLKGSKLEGVSTDETGPWLKEFLETLPEEDRPQGVIQALEELYTLEKEHKKAVIQRDNNAVEKLLHTHVIVDRLKALQPGEFILLPGGWLGHAMLYKWTKQPAGGLIFSVYNYGEGIQYH